MLLYVYMDTLDAPTDTTDPEGRRVQHLRHAKILGYMCFLFAERYAKCYRYFVLNPRYSRLAQQQFGFEPCFILFAQQMYIACGSSITIAAQSPTSQIAEVEVKREGK